MLLESINQRFKTLFHAIYFLPTISSSVALTIIWAYMYAPGWGLLSMIFKGVGLTPPKSWLQDPNKIYFGVPLAMICVVVAHVWQDFGYNLVIFVAALQGIPKSLREADRVDGATIWQGFWLIVVPLLRRTILLASVLTVISSRQVFVIFQLLTRGGPKNQTQTMLLSIYENAFRFANNLGLSAAMSMILFMIILVLKFGLIDSRWALIIPAMVDAYGIFMMKQFIESMPAELLDAARIDGASEFGIYWRIVLPQMGPALASLGIFTFMATWNDYLWPLIVLTSPGKRTIPLLLVWFQTQHTSNQGLVLAASILTLLPIFVVYIFLQRWIVDQATQSAFK